MHPVAQRLTVHPGLIRRLGPGVAVKNERQGEQTAYLRTVTAFGCDRAKVVRGVFGSCNGERFAHWMLQRPESGLGGIESNSRTDSQPPGESRFRTPGISCVLHRLHLPFIVLALPDHSLRYPRLFTAYIAGRRH